MSLAKQVIILLALGALLFGGYVFYDRWSQSVAATAPDQPAGQLSEHAVTPVETVSAVSEPVVTEVEVVGTTRAAQYVDVKPQADGMVTSIGFRPGQIVADGDVLFTLDDDIQKADLAQAKAELAKAQLELDRAMTLKKSNVATRATVDELTAALAVAQASVSRAERRLADRTIRAPFAGKAGFNKVDQGARVTDATELVRLEDLSSVLVEFGVPEKYFGVVKPGLEVKGISAAYPGRVFTAHVTQVGTNIDPISRTFRVRAEIPNEDGALPAGMFMQLTITLQSDALVMVPEEAVVVEGAATHLFVLQDGKVEQRRVTIGPRRPGKVFIASGLEAGEEVVIRGTSKVRDGDAVRVVRSATGAVQ